MNPAALLTTGLGWLNNALSSQIKEHYRLLIYVTESADWVIKQVGVDITRYLNEQKLLAARATTTYRGVRNQIIHFGSRNLFLSTRAYEQVNTSNRVVFSWFHGTEQDKSPSNLAMIKALPEASQKADIVHTSCTISRGNLIKWGVPEDKIVVVPLGIDLKAFQPVSEERKGDIRQELGLPMDKVIIGSFQKDGVGWGEGLEPKWVKGPDVWVRVIEKLKTEYDIFVLLVGPARGYVKKELERIGVPYKHVVLSNYLEIPKHYNALDLYLVTSRAEGGPKAIVEAMACGVPLVSTKVGMALDIIEDGHNGLLTEVEDTTALAEKAGILITDGTLANRLANNALNTVANYSWENITKEYYEKIYIRFLNA